MKPAEVVRLSLYERIAISDRHKKRKGEINQAALKGDETSNDTLSIESETEYAF
jgi:hypothetical protein